MYRVTIESPPEQALHTEFLLDYADAFGEVGFSILNECATPDLRLIHIAIGVDEMLGGTERTDIPTIVHERVDQAGIAVNSDYRNLLARPHVRLWLKRNAFRDLERNNEPYMDGLWHCSEIAKSQGFDLDKVPPLWPQKVLIGPTEWAKVRLLPIVPIRDYVPYLQLKNLMGPRHIDVNMVALADYHAAAQFMIPWHRRAAAKQIIDLKGLRSVLALNRSLGRQAYLDLLTQSRIVVSPWGLGEFAYRDYEAILAGCVLVKPHSDYIRTYDPDIYQNEKYYVACRPDFTDLEEVVRKILDRYDQYREMTMNARRELLRANSKEVVVPYFAELFRSILNTPTHG